MGKLYCKIAISKCKPLWHECDITMHFLNSLNDFSRLQLLRIFTAAKVVHMSDMVDTAFSYGRVLIVC